MVENSTKLVVDRFEIDLGVRLALGVSKSKHVVLPLDYVRGSNVTEDYIDLKCYYVGLQK